MPCQEGWGCCAGGWEVCGLQVGQRQRERGGMPRCRFLPRSPCPDGGVTSFERPSRCFNVATIECF